MSKIWKGVGFPPLPEGRGIQPKISMTEDTKRRLQELLRPTHPIERLVEEFEATSIAPNSELRVRQAKKKNAWSKREKKDE